METLQLKERIASNLIKQENILLEECYYHGFVKELRSFPNILADS